MITSQGRYEPSPAGKLQWWPVKAIAATIVEDDTTGKLALSLDIGQCEIRLFGQTADSLARLGARLIQLADAERQAAAARVGTHEPLQEK